MKTPLLRLASLLLLAPLGAFAATATIKVDIDHAIAPVDPRIYGVFMEPIGFNRPEMKFNTLYGPLYDPKSPLADEHGFRKDMLDAARELQLTQMRWPGGNFVAGYDWRDGIGPKEQRPKRMELAWGVVESNQVGTDEWVQLNKLIGSENVVCINMGTGTLDDARYWVEYCNAPTGTYWADKRAEYGHPEPYGIKYWCLGNEVDGAPWIVGHKNADDYVKFAVEAAKVMRLSSPATKLEFIANGPSYYQDNLDWVEWTATVVKGLYGIADYLSMHRYWDPSDDYYVFVGQRGLDLEERIEIVAGQIKAVHTIKQKRPMYVSVDEWAPPFRGGHLSTLALAQYFNAFVRHADVVKMANYTLLTSLLSRDPKTDATYKSPLFYTFKLFSTRCRGTALATAVNCDTFRTSDHYDKIPYLDVSSVYDEKAQQVIINVVNRHKDEPIATDIRSLTGAFTGTATVSSVTSADVSNQPYTYEARDAYPPKVEHVAAQGPTLHWVFPAHSFTQIVVAVNR
ncbi:alpha-L-arabinofuranosidase C-terminal domain-containing protein [Opitutus terrae]|uniref:non-reducing end alpha-L-arabinofuranosidase n=1 Tax=Opitutus terrae (strain DSM 11246 / JCM 15787 / PB90-1) TaxID=452637 RepID=B1ZN54_OPITP|nr:alpha-L-arabinofuranosidase C-terminal domain-containing protein [Opitutus terrae]ACB76505.1 Alpha-N-arabinofuranosidase [Opitutus terrae PB90-1]